MFRAWSDNLGGAFCRGVIGFELCIVFMRSVQKCLQSLLGHLRWGFLQMCPRFSELCTIFVETYISDALLDSEHVSMGSCKISTTVINSKSQYTWQYFCMVHCPNLRLSFNLVQFLQNIFPQGSKD